jgi:PBP1b-binding outer membrane lipoprotein LpoB
MRKVVMVGVLGCALVLGGCVQGIARSRVQTALTNAGLPQPMAECMATRMVDHLTIAQLRKLEALQGPKRSAMDYAMAVQRVGDPEVIQVTMSAAGACAGQTGLLGGLLR